MFLPLNYFNTFPNFKKENVFRERIKDIKENFHFVRDCSKETSTLHLSTLVVDPTLASDIVIL